MRSTKIIPGSGEDYRIHKSRNLTRGNGAGSLWGVHIIPGANPGYTVHLFCRYIEYFVVELNSFNLECLFNCTQIIRRMNYLRCFGFGGNLRPELCTFLLLDPKSSYHNEHVIHAEYTESKGEERESMIKRSAPRLVSGNDNVTEIRSMEKAKPWSGAGKGGSTKSKTNRVMVSTIEVLRSAGFPIETKKVMPKRDEDTHSSRLSRQVLSTRKPDELGVCAEQIQGWQLAVALSYRIPTCTKAKKTSVLSVAGARWQQPGHCGMSRRSPLDLNTQYSIFGSESAHITESRQSLLVSSSGGFAKFPRTGILQ